ncbi:MAG: S41 family peptidase [Actinomycetota bacterium]|nr:S41 family peptidase [Actinomycetota bacterium]
MRRVAIFGLLLIAACGVASDATTTTTTGATATFPATTTTQPALEFTVQNCASPPITFSALCEVYDLTQEWHVDRPVPDSVLAEVAIEALQAYTSDETAERPRELLCAVPNDAFYGLCAQLAFMIDESSIDVGPAVDAAVTAMADIGLDPFSYYVPPEQVGSFRDNGVVGGIGVLLDATDAAGSRCTLITATCPLHIVFVLENNPAAEAGLRAGDQITAVDGEPVEGQGFLATTSKLAADETGSVTVTYLRDGQTSEATMDRGQLTIPTVTVDLPLQGVGYLRIPDFEDDIPDLVAEALISLAEHSPGTIVVDLRDNPGGFINAAVDVASEFIDGGIVMTSVGPDEDLEYPATVGGLATSERLIVLVNKGSASAAEILAGALRDERGATIVGTNTFGKDAVQIPFDMRNGGEFYVAVARWFTPNGDTVANGGLVPDRELELSPDLSNEEVVRAVLEAVS